MKQDTKQKKINCKMNESIFNVLVRMRLLAIRNKLEPTKIHLLFIKIIMVISIYQKIEIITQKQHLDNGNFSLQEALFSVYQKYSIDYVKYLKLEYLLVLICITQLLYFISFLILIIHNQNNLLVVNLLLNYYQIIHHYILLFPMLNISFYLVVSTQNIVLPFIVIFLILILELNTYFSNYLNKIIEIEGNFSNQITDAIYIFLLFASSLVVQYTQNYLFAQILLILAHLLLLIKKIHNYHYNSYFDLQANTSIISYIIILLLDQTWYTAIILHSFLINLIHSIRLKKLQLEITQKSSQISLFKYSIFDNPEFLSKYQNLAIFLRKTQSQQLIKFESDIQQQNLNAEKIKILLNIFKYQQTKLCLSLIKANKSDFSYTQYINLEANLQNIRSICQKIVNSKLDIQDFVQSLKIEQESFSNLIAFIEKKIYFYHIINKEIPLDQYLVKFTKNLNKILEALDSFQSSFENQFDLVNGKLKQSKHSDRISLNLVIAYITVFYENPYQVGDILKKQNDLLSYDKLTNYKIEQNDVLLISTSLFKQPNMIINNNSKRLQKIFGDQIRPKQFSELLPQFQQKYYEGYIEEFIENGFEKQQTVNVFLNQNEYLLEGELQIFVQIQNDDIVLNSLLTLKSQPNHILIFDEKGKILGISKDIYLFLIKKSEDKFTQELQVNQFIQKGMIQYYVTDINNQIKYLIQLDDLGKWQNQISFSSKWQFPQNHKQCLKQSQTITVTNENAQNTDQIEFESPQTSLQRDDTIDFLRKSTKMIIDINQDVLKNKLQYSAQDYISFEASMRLSLPISKNQQESFFVLKIQNIAGQQEEKQICNIVEKYQLIECCDDDNQSSGLQLLYLFLFGKTHQKPLYTPLKYNILTVFIMIFITSLSLVINYQLNYQHMLNYRNDVNFLKTPQGMTFNYAGPFYLQWNYFCIINNLYEISAFLEDRREFALVAAFDYWKSVHNEFSLNLSLKSSDFGYPFFNITRFTTINQLNSNQSIYENHTEQTNLFEFYAILRETLIRQFTQTIFLNQSSFDPDSLKTIGLVRYNMLPMLKFHTIVLDDVIAQTSQSFSEFENKTLIFCVLSAIVILALLFILFLINFVLLGVQAKLVKLLQYITPKSIYEQEVIYEKLKSKFNNLMIDQNEQQHISSHQLAEKIIHSDPKGSVLKKIDSYKESYSLLSFLTIFIGVELIMFIFGSKFVAQLYNSQYQNSLILTMQFLKLKTRLDTAVLYGELIKTEHLIKNNTNIAFINQTESIEFFFENLDSVLSLGNEINNNFITTDSYNSSFQTRLIQIFNNNLCMYYTDYMSFCQNPSTISQYYYPGENYTSIIHDGILGIIGNLNELAQSEFSFEQTEKTYEYNLLHSNQYLNSQKHIQLFLWYFIEIEYCIFLCFLDIFEETLNISANLSKQILVYLLSSSAAFLIMTLFLSGFWVFKQYKKLNRLKLMITLIPKQLLSQRSFNKLLYYHLSQIK